MSYFTFNYNYNSNYSCKIFISFVSGLVGALSIVRFRAAIKEPEELVYLFLIIGIGLASGSVNLR